MLASTESGSWIPTAIAAGVIALGAGVIVLARGRGVRARGEPGGAVVRDARELGEMLARDLDARAERLEGLIARAEAAAERLETAVRLEGAVRPEGAVREPAPVEPARGAPAVAAMRGGAVVEPRGPGDAFAEVSALADRGVSAAEIARRLGRPIGQVELMLNLRRAAGKVEG